MHFAIAFIQPARSASRYLYLPYKIINKHIVIDVYLYPALTHSGSVVNMMFTKQAQQINSRLLRKPWEDENGFQR